MQPLDHVRVVIADLDRQIADCVRLRHFLIDFYGVTSAGTNSAASTQEAPRPMEGAADRGEVRPGLAATNPAPVLSQGERVADAVDLAASTAGEVGPETVGASPAPLPTGKTAGPSGSAAPSLADRLRNLNAEHPEFTVQQAAQALGETFERVRNNSNAHKIRWNNEAVRSVGLQDRVAEVHREHPDWGDAEIAAEIGKSNGYVRATAQRLGLVLPSRKRPETIAEPPAEPVQADEPAEAQEPAPKPEPTPASTPEPANDMPRIVRPRSGSKFYLVNENDEYLNRFCAGFTRDRREAWIGTEQQLAGCRRNFTIARDLTEKAVARELAPAPINREVA